MRAKISILIISFGIILIVIFLLVVFKSKNSIDTQDYNLAQDNLSPSLENDSSQTDVKVYEQETVILQSSSSEWKNDSEYEVFVDFEQLPDPPPVSLTLVLNYDPALVEIIDVKEGNLWTQTNVLEEKIDGSKGTVRFSIGRGLQEEVTGQKRIAVVSAKAKDENSGLTQIEIDEESVFVSTSEKGYIKLKGLPIKLTVMESEP